MGEHDERAVSGAEVGTYDVGAAIVRVLALRLAADQHLQLVPPVLRLHFFLGDLKRRRARGPVKARG